MQPKPHSWFIDQNWLKIYSAFPKSILRSIALARPTDWITSKLPFLASIYLLGSPCKVGLDSLIASMVMVCGLATFGFAINDIADQKYDILAGKNNRAVGLSIAQQAGVLIFAAFGGIGASLYLSTSILAQSLFVANLILATCYSIRPLRLKERGLAGIAVAAICQWCIPSAVIFAEQFESQTSLSIWPLMILGLALGVRWMAIHQYQDIAADKCAGVTTFATQGGSVRTIISVAFFSEFILLLSTLVLYWPSSLDAIVALGIWFSHTLFTTSKRSAFGESLLTYSDAPLASYYFLLLPLALAVNRMSSMDGALFAFILFAALGYNHAIKFWGETMDVICGVKR